MSISAVLLAGGESKRMGREKAILQWHGRLLWEWQIEKLRELKPERILLSARADVSWRPTDAELVIDIAPSRGPLSGLASSFAIIETDYLIVLAVDMPFLTTEHLRDLCGHVAKGVGVIPTIDGQAEPLCAIYPKEARELFLEALRGQNFSVQPLVRKLVALNMLREIPVSGSAREFYKSVNEPEDIS
jgi:molybdopterin-guanine dinucleotide biosynthesis protein A